jgi:tRNA nucleotidyltransferase (CCA-adding enzyme)
MTIPLEPTLEAVLRDVGAAAARRDAAAWGVGGVVRDALTGHPNKDVDITVVGDAAAVASDLRDAWSAELEIHAAFSTATLHRADGYHVDIVRARSETYPQPGALPVISPAGLEEDLLRRDFSINAMAVSLGARDFGALEDPLGGADDLGAKRLRTLHPGSFVDDPTRLFRASRYAARYDLAPDERTDATGREAVAHGALRTVSTDRLRREVERTCEERAWAVALEWLNRWDTWSAMGGAAVSKTPLRRADATLAWAARSVSEAVPDIATFRVLTFLAVNPPTLWKSLSVKPAEAALVFAAFGVAGAPETPDGWRRLDERTMTELLLGLCVSGSDAEKRRLTRYITDIRPLRPVIRGADLLAAGARPGPGVGLALRDTLDAVRLGRLHGAAAELEHALRVWKEWKARAAG